MLRVLGFSTMAKNFQNTDSLVNFFETPFKTLDILQDVPKLWPFGLIKSFACMLTSFSKVFRSFSIFSTGKTSEHISKFQPMPFWNNSAWMSKTELYTTFTLKNKQTRSLTLLAKNHTSFNQYLINLFTSWLHWQHCYSYKVGLFQLHFRLWRRQCLLI